MIKYILEIKQIGTKSEVGIQFSHNTETVDESKPMEIIFAELLIPLIRNEIDDVMKYITKEADANGIGTRQVIIERD